MDIHINKLAFSWPGASFELKIPSLEVAKGESLAIIGPSGCGKTTLLKLLAGMVLADSGELLLGELDWRAQTETQRRRFRQHAIGFIYQDFRLLDYLNIQDNILLPWRLTQDCGLDHSRAWARLEALAQGLGLTDLMSRSLDQISSGERQRVAIARALLMRPQLLLADEPTGNLDPSNKQRVCDLLHDKAREHQATLIMVTHDQALVDRFDHLFDFSQQCEIQSGKEPV